MKPQIQPFLSRRLFCRHFLFALLASLLLAPAHADGGRERLSLDRGWLFHLGDIPFHVPATQDETYYATKAGLASGAAAVKYDASAWRKLDLPHDWQIEQPFDVKANPAQGFRQRGIGWYRRYLAVPESDRGRHIELEFGAIATHATVWVNGNLVSRNWSGYNEIRIDITPYLLYGDNNPNVIAVRVDADAMEGWWYEGAGMYRHTWLVKTDAVHIVPDGVRVTPRQLKGDSWEIPAQVTLDNDGKQAARVDVEMIVTGPDGKLVARHSTSIDVPVLTQVTASLPLAIRRPALWSLDKAALYHVTTTVRRNGKTVDQLAQDTGFRSLRFDAGRALEEVNSEYSTSTELADVLQREANVPFRVGHHFVSELVNYGRANGLVPAVIPFDQVERIYAATAKEALIDQGGSFPLTEARFREALTAENMIRSSKGIGGPQPAEVARMLEVERASLKVDQGWVDNQQRALAEASQHLNDAFERLRR